MTEPLSAVDWRRRVQDAAIAKDGAALRALFSEATALFGDRASAEWADALSAFDASAQTG